jgi:ABC-type dipeptide/oligopeptide/nickel transport system permease subunit
MEGYGLPFIKSQQHCERLLYSQEELTVVTQNSRFRQNFLRYPGVRLALTGLIVVCLCAAFADFLAPYRNFYTNRSLNFSPPTRVRFFDDQGQLTRPFIYLYRRSYDLMGRPVYQVDRSERFEVQFFVRSSDPRARYTPFPLNLIPAFLRDRLSINITSDLKLFGLAAPTDNVPFYLLGSDIVGNDIFSSILYGSRWNLAIGAAGTLLTAIIGFGMALMGRVLGKTIDWLIMAIGVVIALMPHIFLLLALLILFYGLRLPLWVAIGSVLIDAALIDLDAVLHGFRKLLYREPPDSPFPDILPPQDLFSHILEHSLGYLIIGWGFVLAVQSSFFDASYLERWWILIPAPVLLLVVIAWTLVGDALHTAMARTIRPEVPPS